MFGCHLKDSHMPLPASVDGIAYVLILSCNQIDPACQKYNLGRQARGPYDAQRRQSPLGRPMIRFSRHFMLFSAARVMDGSSSPADM